MRPEGCELQLRRAWRCLQLAHVWAEEDRVCSKPWLPECVEPSAEKPPAPQSAGVGDARSEGVGSRRAEVSLLLGTGASRSGAVPWAPRQAERDPQLPRVTSHLASVWTGSGQQCLVSPLVDAGLIC